MVGETTVGRAGRLVAVAGNVVATPEHSLSLIYRDGATRRIPLTYVTNPIAAAFFYASIPVERQHGTRSPARLQLRRGGTIVETSVLVVPRRR